ncbi:UspA domain-containing protein [Allomuricauda ruestringensis DSM 13258]|uniref:UspA domain-containing protein n=1 Tax=Allomuricauda ruestringensis (strain DSM 13258 / CIP 107369 / LMG 19739 / B1) TaxID=886377 RepID=G2PJ46_ALLRU|nr:universal stress protein [Allomuricauda ruestringensis]AEM71867.1 UspA domain-containing protein [Allomuricauda ruestringensis DSM 13258]
MKKILVPVDFSEHSEYALEVASKIAKQHGAGIILFHMLGLSDSVLANSEIAEEAEAKYYLKLAKEKIKEYTEKEYLKNVSVETIIQNYKDFEEVNAVAQEQHCDLVVMGSHGTSGFSELFVGSNTEKVVRTSDIPVIVIKDQHEDFTIKKIVMASDFAKENISVYKKADAFAKLYKASLEVVYINTTGANFIGYDIVEKRMEAFKKELGKDIQINFYSHPSLERGIFKYCNEKDADLLVIPTHGRKGLAHFVVGSLAENVSNHAELPVMTIKL